MATGRTRVAAVVLCLLVILGADAAIAGASRTVKIGSKLSISDQGLTFKGRVTSSNAACVTPRRVVLYRSNGLKLGSVNTGSTGRWKISVSGSAGISLGHFYAKVRQRTEGTAGTIYVCKAATSKTIPFKQ